MTRSECILALTALASDLSRKAVEMKDLRAAVLDCKRFVLEGLTKPVAQEPVSQGRTELHAAVERLFAEVAAWKGVDEYGNPADGPAAQALKALLAQEPQS